MLFILAIVAAVVFWAAFVPPMIRPTKRPTPTWAELSADWRRLKQED